MYPQDGVDEVLHVTLDELTVDVAVGDSAGVTFVFVDIVDIDVGVGVVVGIVVVVKLLQSPQTPCILQLEKTHLPFSHIYLFDPPAKQPYSHVDPLVEQLLVYPHDWLEGILHIGVDDIGVELDGVT